MVEKLAFHIQRGIIGVKKDTLISKELGIQIKNK
jgi:hypothetical protein